MSGIQKGMPSFSEDLCACNTK